MFCFIVLHEDTHFGVELKAFQRVSKALEHARELLATYPRFKDGTEEQLTDGMRRNGWLFYGRYGEGESIKVQQLELLP